MVSLVKQKFPGKATLAIGDGANDVAMIMEAHVGLGIAGHEGMQAARAADYSFGEFKELQPLLMIHGRECYRRNSDLVCWNFYKNMLYIVTQFWFGAYSVFSGQPLYEPYLYQMFNFTNTAISIFYYAWFDYEFEKKVFMQRPELYQKGIKNENFTHFRFMTWIATAWV